MAFEDWFRGNRRFKKKAQKRLRCTDEKECERAFKRLSKKDKKKLMAQGGECPCQIE